MRFYVLTVVVTALLTLGLTALVWKLGLRYRLYPEIRERDVHTTPKPRIGGVAMYVGVLAAFTGAEGQHVEVDADLAQQVAAAGALGGEVDARCGGHGMAFGRGRSAGRRRSGRVARF